MPAVPNELSVCSRIMLVMQEQLRALNFRAVANESVSSVDVEAVVIRRLQTQDAQEGETSFAMERLPGLIISPPNMIQRPATEGENNEDEVHYQILVQICDRHFEDSGGLHTYLAWQQKIARHFARTDLSSRVFDEDGYVYFGHADQVQTIDERMFNRYWMAKAFVVVHYIANEP